VVPVVGRGGGLESDGFVLVRLAGIWFQSQ
jgi:hypothetical protein